MLEIKPQDRDTIAIVDAADRIGVSTATIRNWIKLGYLERAGRGRLFCDSLERYQAEVVGREKLTRRANKRHKSEEVEQTLDLSSWWQYEEGLAESHRNKEGIYYTPTSIVDDMLSRATEGRDLSGKTFLDPACGSGNFIIRAIELGFDPHNVYGYDTDESAVRITHHRIKELTGYDSPNILCADFLELADTIEERFDFIFTNPPWGKKYLRRMGVELSKRYNTGASRDSSSLFVNASLGVLSSGGVLGFLLQQAFFNIRSYAVVRGQLLRYQIDRFVDYGRSFRSLMTKAQAIVLTKCEARDGWMVDCGGQYRSQRSFVDMPNSIFNFSRTEEETDVIRSLFCRPHINLSSGVMWGMGIVTGDNRRFCREVAMEGCVELYRGSDITTDGLKGASLYISDDLSLYQQAAPRYIYAAPCKLIYRFISSRLCFVCDRKQRLILNSANCLIPSSDLPIEPEELVKLLNSDFMSWLFSAIFMTHKVLRRDLEQLPIFPDYFLSHESFDEAQYLAYLGIEHIFEKKIKCLDKNHYLYRR